MTVESLTEARWNRLKDTRDHTAADALRVALANVERGDIKVDHVVICFGAVSTENAATTDWFQAGEFSAFEQLGLLERVKIAIIMNAEQG